MLRLKVQTIRNLLWLGNLLVFVGVALLMAKMWAAKEAGALKHLPVDRIEKEMNSDGTIKNEVLEGVKGYPYYAACVNLNITGVEPVNATDGKRGW